MVIEGEKKDICTEVKPEGLELDPYYDRVTLSIQINRGKQYRSQHYMKLYFVILTSL